MLSSDELDVCPQMLEAQGKGEGNWWQKMCGSRALAPAVTGPHLATHQVTGGQGSGMPGISVRGESEK